MKNRGLLGLSLLTVVGLLMAGFLQLYLVAPQPALASPDTANLIVIDGYDEKNVKTLEEMDKTYMVQTSDDDWWEIEAGFYTSFEFSDVSIPGGATITSVIIHVEHYEESGFQGNVEWKVGTGWPSSPAEWGSTTSIPLRKGEGNEATDSWDVTSFVDTPTKVNALELCITNNSSNGKKTKEDYIWSEVTYTPPIISITVTDGTVAYGTVAVGATEDTTASGLNDTQTATNNGNVAEKFQIKSSHAIGAMDWTLGSSQGDNTFTHKASIDGGNNWSIAMEVAGTYYELVASVPAEGYQDFDLQIGMPTTITDYGEHTITVTVLATAA